MTSRVLIWTVVILFCFFFAGHLFDLIVNVPNWQSGEIETISNYRDFYWKTTPKAYFLPLMIGTFLVSLIAYLSVRGENKTIKVYILTCILISLIVFLFTIILFVPINEYIFSTSDYEPDKLEGLVNKWVKFDYLRLLLVGVGLASSILGLNAYYNK
jgi:glucan phosphoethanolaminetransferase (alkaline phosphatase superfamily)